MRAIFERDFLRFARTKRFFVMRTCIVGLPGGLLVLIAASLKGIAPDTIGLAIFGSTTFTLLVLAILVTPAMLCNVLVEEKRNNVWEVLRSVPITVGGIVCGKWLSRLSLLMVVCLAALPLTAISLLFGGVSISMFLRAAAVLFLSVMWVSAFSVCVSAVARDLVVAARTAYVAIVLYVLGGMVAMPFVGLWAASRAGRPVVAGVFEGILSLNPLLMMFSVLASRIPGAAALHPLGIDPLLGYFLFSALTTAGFILASIRVLMRERQVSAAATPAVARAGAEVPTLAPSMGAGEPAGAPARSTTLVRVPGRFSRGLRGLSRRPALWLEQRRGTPKRRSIPRVLALGGICIVESFFVYGLYATRGGTGFSEFHYLPVLFTLGAAIIAVASAGAAAFHRDNELKTLEILHSTPLSSRSLAAGKMLSVLRSALPWWGLSVVNDLLAVAFGDHHPIEWLGYVVVSAVLLASLAAFSMQMSLSARSSARALVRTMLVVAIHLIVYPMLFVMAMSFGGGGDEEVTAAVFLGHHPFFIALLPHLLAEEDFFRFDGWFIPVVYLFGYYLHAGIALGSSIPGRYAAKRAENWSATGAKRVPVASSTLASVHGESGKKGRPSPVASRSEERSGHEH